MPPCGVVEQGDAVPQDVAMRGAHEQRPLPDRERRFHADADEVGLLLAQHHGVLPGEVGHGGPLLPIPPDILAFVLADRAVSRWPTCVGVLDATGHTDPSWHCHTLLQIDERGAAVSATSNLLTANLPYAAAVELETPAHA